MFPRSGVGGTTPPHYSSWYTSTSRPSHRLRISEPPQGAPHLHLALPGAPTCTSRRQFSPPPPGTAGAPHLHPPSCSTCTHCTARPLQPYFLLADAISLHPCPYSRPLAALPGIHIDFGVLGAISSEEAARWIGFVRQELVSVAPA